MNSRKTKPRGKVEVKDAILDAATKLFAQRGVSAVSLRDIAQEAGINHGLIHRHFGSKENLRLEVQNRLMVKINESIGVFSSPQDALARGIHALEENEEFWKVLARTFLDGPFEGDVQSAFPFMQKMVGLISGEQRKGTIRKSIDPRILVAGGTALVYGLFVFEDYILPATGLNEEPSSDIKNKIISTWLSLTTE